MDTITATIVPIGRVIKATPEAWVTPRALVTTIKLIIRKGVIAGKRERENFFFDYIAMETCATELLGSPA